MMSDVHLIDAVTNARTSGAIEQRPLSLLGGGHRPGPDDPRTPLFAVRLVITLFVYIRGEPSARQGRCHSAGQGLTAADMGNSAAYGRAEQRAE